MVTSSFVTHLVLRMIFGESTQKFCSLSWLVGCTMSPRAPKPSHENGVTTRSAPYLSFWTPSPRSSDPVCAVVRLLDTDENIPKTARDASHWAAVESASRLMSVPSPYSYWT